MITASAGRAALTAALIALAVTSLLLALTAGSMTIEPGDLWRALGNQGPELTITIVRELRLPRALTAFAVGGLLALSGVLLQALLRNPLADPYVLGISGGAGVLALTAMLLGLATTWIGVAAFAGSLLSMLLVFGLSHGRGAWTPTRLLLTGVIVAAGWGALISLLLSLAPSARLPGMLFWLMGEITAGTQPQAGLLLLAIGTLASLALGRSLNLLVRGELVAAALGEPTGRVRLAIYFLASTMTAAAVTLAGSIGFVGLVVPHVLRLLGSTDHRRLLPQAALLGGSLLVIADTLARTVVAPVQLPVGVITALLGVPLFLFLLTRGRIA